MEGKTMEISTNTLRKKAEELYKQSKFKEIITLLTDEVLEREKEAKLYAWRARANHRSDYDVAVTMLFAEKAIEADPNYFMGYFARACAWEGKQENDQAIADYTKALELNPDCADAYYNRGLAWQSKQENDQAIADYTKAIKLNPDFADAYYNRGLAWQSRKENDKVNAEDEKTIADYDRAIADFNKAIVIYNKSIKINPKDADLYVGRGNAWYYERNYDKAIADYTKAIELNPDFADAYYNRGLAWFASKKYDNAIEDYTKVLDLKSDYADAYYVDRGNAWKAAGKYKEAIEDYTQAIALKPDFENAYYFRGLAKKEEDIDLEGSKQDFEKYLKLTIDDNEIWAKYAKCYIEELTENINNPELRSIGQLVNDIKDILWIKGECVTHFTSFSVLKKLILEESKFRISEGNFMNDPSEGKEFFNFLEYNPYTSYEDGSIKDDSLYKNGFSAETFSSKPFIGSFVTEDMHNDLNMWRFYGKEKGVEAKGCAITLRTQEFIEDIKHFLSNEKKEARQDDESDINFYRVAYSRGSANFTIPGSDKSEKLMKLMTELKKKVKSYEVKDKTSLERYLNSIAFLFKSDAYKNENEVRLIVKGIEFDKKYNMDLTPPRVYIELEPVKKIVKQITLGPKVDKVHEWASALHYSYEVNAPEIIISHLP